MKTPLIIIMSCCFMLTACSSGPLLTAKKDDVGLTEVVNGPFDEVFFDPQYNLNGYSNIEITPVTYSNNNADNFQLEQDSINEITETLFNLIVKDMADNTGLETTSGSDAKTLRLTLILEDVDVNVPKNHKESSASRIYSKSLVSATLVGTLSDAITGKPIANFKDKQAPEAFSFQEVNRITVTAELRRILKKWSSKLSTGLADLKLQSE